MPERRLRQFRRQALAAPRLSGLEHVEVGECLLTLAVVDRAAREPARRRLSSRTATGRPHGGARISTIPMITTGLIAVAPTLVRSQALSALYEASCRGEISAAEGPER
jgi:hypothetical protein